MTTGYALACEGCGRWVWGGGMYHSAVREPDVHATEALDLRSVHVIETVVAQHHGASPRRQAVAARGVHALVTKSTVTITLLSFDL